MGARLLMIACVVVPLLSGCAEKANVQGNWYLLPRGQKAPEVVVSLVNNGPKSLPNATVEFPGRSSFDHIALTPGRLVVFPLGDFTCVVPLFARISENGKEEATITLAGEFSWLPRQAEKDCTPGR